MTSALTKRKRKFWMMLPLLVVPFLTLLFWKFRGGDAQASSHTAPQGVNLSLPDAAPKNQDNWTKLDYYRKAEADSSKLLAQLKKNSRQSMPSIFQNEDTGDREMQMNKKLAAIEREINEGERGFARDRPRSRANPRVVQPTDNAEKIEQLVRRVERPSTPDPELQELNAMLDKLTALENPGSKSPVNADSVMGLPVTPAGDFSAIASQDAAIAFYGLPAALSAEPEGQSIIKAIVARNITVQTASAVPLRLLTKLKIGGQVLPAGTAVFATTNIQGNKLMLTVSAILFDGQLLPVQLSAYDRTGIAGIAIQSSTAGDFTRQSSQRAVGSIGFNSLNPTVEGQLAEAGLQTVKGLLGKKVKTPTVQLYAGDEILLVDQLTKK